MEEHSNSIISLSLNANQGNFTRLPYFVKQKFERRNGKALSTLPYTKMFGDFSIYFFVKQCAYNGVAFLFPYAPLQAF